MIAAGTLFITEKSGPEVATTSVGTIVNVKLSGLDWSDLKASGEHDAAPVLRRQAADQAANASSGIVFVAERAGTVQLSAHGRAHCEPGQMCPRFVVAWRKTITVTSGKAAP